MKKILLLFLITTFSIKAYTQDTEFWFAGYESHNSPNLVAEAGFLFSNPSSNATTITIEFFDGVSPSQITFTMPANSGYHFNETTQPTFVRTRLENSRTNAGVAAPGGIRIT